MGNMIRPNDKARVHSLLKLKLDKDPGKNKMLRRLLALLSNDLESAISAWKALKTKMTTMALRIILARML